MTFWILIIGIMLASWAVSARFKNRMRHFSQIPVRSGMSGAEVADRMLRDHGINDVDIVTTGGSLTDHYNPLNKTINLSEEVFYGRSVAAAAIAAHETGHAVQHAQAYAPLKLRSALVPVQNASSTILNVLFYAMLASLILPFYIPFQTLILVYIGCYAVITAFSFITLPVEFDATKRALAWVDNSGVVSSQELSGARNALNWAAMTYVIAALGSLSILMYYVLSYIGMDD